MTVWGACEAFQRGEGLHRLGHHRLQVGRGQKGRGCRDEEARPAEVGEGQPRLGQDLQMLPDPIGLGRRHLHHLGEEQRLAGRLGGLGLQGFIEDPFVGGVLVDEDEAVGARGQDIGVFQLADDPEVLEAPGPGA